MKEKLKEKQKAIEFRKRGFSYSEILKKLPVSKSSLSSWLRSVDISELQREKLAKKKRLAQLKGAEARRRQRIECTQKIYQEAENDIDKISTRELWLIGIILYWAEGEKEKFYRTGCRVTLANSDPKIISIFLKWLLCICKIKQEKIIFEIYVHESHEDRVKMIKQYWQEKINFPKEYFNRIYFKKCNTRTNRKNINTSYYGLIKIKVRASSALNRRIYGWTQGISKILLDNKWL